MIEFLRVQYRLGRVTETQLDMLIAQGKITEEDKAYIMSYDA
jgi:hypothetical protein